jgi:phosphoglycerate kinase
VFVNEAFAVGHRVAASTTGLPKLLPSFLGFQFEREVEAVSKALHDPKKPVIGILGGAKPDKLENVDNFLTHVDKLLLGGRLGEFAQPNPKLEIASLTSDGLDIDLQTSTRFARLISEAGTLIWNGPMGKYEDVNHIKGTQVIAEAIAASSAYKIAGGGDTIAVINKLELKEKFDHISIGGGAMMYLLANGSLPSLEAIHTQNMDKDL